jgi:hypothetical protein
VAAIVARLAAQTEAALARLAAFAPRA